MNQNALTLPKKMAAAQANQQDLSSICNYADISPPSGFMYEEISAVGTTPKSAFAGIEETPFAYRDEAIPFITVTEDSKQFEVHPEAVRLLESIDGEIGVVTIAGPYRTGKSSLAGRALLANPKAFQSAPTVNACTKGLWIYARPITDCKTAEGDQATAVVIDSEGLNALDESENHDLRIMTLSVLLSSKLIYNSMSAIDEQSLSQLNLVVNLTKQIQLKTSSSVGEFQDPEELAKIFPSFLWLVRDFNLALVNQEGESITAREYLEISLQEQSGMSERTEAKNRTRRLFKSLFTDRDCITFDRPICEESDLQNLSEIPDEQLKKSFVRQLETLKKRVLRKMQVKTVHGRPITGRILVTLAKQYVNAFNVGQVPNIESAWTYICRNESLKALAMARSQFKSVLEQKMTLPCSLFDLECDYKDAKREAVKVFTQCAIKDEKSTQLTLEQLKRECKEMYEQIKVRNDENCTAACTQFLNQFHHEIMTSLTQNFISEKDEQESGTKTVFKDLNQVEAALYNIEENFEKSGPSGDQSMRQLIYEKFRSQIAFESGNHFLMLHRREGQTNVALLEAKCVTLQKDLAQEKRQNQSQHEDLQAQVRSKERELSEMQALKELADERCATLEAKQVEETRSLRAEFDLEKQKLQVTLLDAKRQKEATEAELQKIKRQMVEVSSAAERDKALQDQEISHLKAQEVALKSREIELIDEIKQIGSSRSEEVKERETSLQAALDQARRETSEAIERAQDLAEQLQATKSELEDIQKSFNQQNEQFKAKLEEAQQSITTTSDGSGRIDQLQKELADAQQSIQDVTKQLQDQKEAHKSELTSLMSEKENLAAQKQKEIAILAQKATQSEEQIASLQRQVESSKIDLNSILAKFQTQSDEAGPRATEQQALIDSLQKAHEDEQKALIEQHEEETQQLRTELDTMSRKLEEASLSQKVESAALQQSVQELQDQVAGLEMDKARLEKQCKAQRERNESIIEQMHSKSSQSVVELTQQHEIQIREFEEQIRETQEQTKQELAKLKITHENEKEQVMQKWQEDKLKLKQHEEELRADYETRISEDELKFEEERQFLQSQLSQLQYESKAQLDKAQRDLLLLRNEHENLSVIHNEKLGQLKTLQESSASHLQVQIRSHTEQLANLQGKLDTQSTQMKSKEQALITANLSLDHAKADLQRRKAQLTALEESQKSELDKLESKIDALRAENQELKDEVQAKKIEFSREIALKNQSIEFLERKIVDQQSMADTRYRELEEQVESVKTERSQQIGELTWSFNEQKSEIESKFESKRKALKALQAEFNQKLPELERKNALLVQQVAQLKRQIKDQGLELQSRLEQTNEEFHSAQDQAATELKTALKKVEVSKARIVELEKEHQSLLSESEKDKALFEDKVKFLTEQKSRLESEKSELERRLKEEQESLQRIRSLEKEKATKNRQECVTHLETYYKQLTQRIQDENKKLAEESQTKTRMLQEQNQELQTQLEILKRERDNSTKHVLERQGKQDKIESCLRQEIASLKSSNEVALSKQSTKFEQQMEAIKLKLSKSEKERKEIELTQTSLRHNFSIEEAKWNMKSEQLQNDVRSLTEEVDRLMKKNETLIRENQKIRTSHRNQLQSSLGFAANRSSNYLNSTQSLKLNQFSGNKSQANLSYIPTAAAAITTEAQKQTDELSGVRQPPHDGTESKVEKTQFEEAQVSSCIQEEAETEQQPKQQSQIEEHGDEDQQMVPLSISQLRQRKEETAGAGFSRHQRNPASTSTKVVLATFSAKTTVKQSSGSGSLLSKQIKESMARCSPKTGQQRVGLSSRHHNTRSQTNILIPQQQKIMANGLASKMTKKSLLPNNSNNARKLEGQTERTQPFRACENTMNSSEVQQFTSDCNLQTMALQNNVTIAQSYGQSNTFTKSASINDENKEVVQSEETTAIKSTAMTLDELLD